jgi:two-component system, cell cycle response regulator DivK
VCRRPFGCNPLEETRIRAPPCERTTIDQTLGSSPHPSPMKEIMERAGASHAPAPTVLVVDSYDSSREALCELLQEWGCSVLQVRNGVEGLRVARERHPELVIVDLWPDFAASLQMIEGLRQSRSTQRVPVLILTAAASPGFRRRALEAGCDAYLEKPCHAGELQAQLCRVLAAGRTPDGGASRLAAFAQ